MVEVRFELDREKGFLSMEVLGHAGFAQLGKDPVCAGASVLAMTLAQCAGTMEEAGRLGKKAHIVVRGGRVLVTVKPKPERWDEAAQMFRVGETGFRLLAEAYPENVIIRNSVFENRN